jgi:TIR domain
VTGESPQTEISDVFIAHASEDKEEIARPLSEALIAEGWSVWLDELRLKVGDSLSRHIDAALARTRFGIVVLSPNFFAKEWPQRELAGLAARELDSGSKVILPVWHGVDHNFIVQHSPVLADRLGALASAGIEAVCQEISSVLADDHAKGAVSAPDQGGGTKGSSMQDGESMFEIPAMSEQQSQLLRDRPDWWEHRLYAGVLLQGRIELEDKWQDHQLRLPRGARRDVDDASFAETLKRELGWMRRQVSAMDRIFASEITEKAFGPRGESGDPLLIRRIAEGVIRIYEALMDWAANLRTMSVDEDYEEIVELTARMADGPVRQIHDFIQLVADQIARIPVLEKAAAEEGATEESPAVLTLSLTLSLDEGVQEELHAALARAR